MTLGRNSPEGVSPGIYLPPFVVLIQSNECSFCNQCEVSAPPYYAPLVSVVSKRRFVDNIFTKGENASYEKYSPHLHTHLFHECPCHVAKPCRTRLSGCKRFQPGESTQHTGFRVLVSRKNTRSADRDEKNVGMSASLRPAGRRIVSRNCAATGP